MGSGIAQVFAANGYDVVMYDISGSMLDKAAFRINEELDKLVAKNKITGEQRSAILAHLSFSNTLQECKAKLVIEAVVEDAGVKVKLLNELLQVNNSDTIVVTNTSSLSVTQLAEHISAPDRFAGMHFFNPATLMKLVEIITTPFVSPAVIGFLREVAVSVGKSPVVCKDAPGFIVNRVARSYYLESLFLLENQYGDVETIDRLLESTGFRMGPFRLMDLIGNDVNYSVSTIVYEALNKPERLKPSVIQLQKVENGLLGKKTGKGFYEYPG